MHLLRDPLPRPDRGEHLTTRPACLLIGLGNRDRADDAIGPVVVAAAAQRLDGQTSNVRIVEHDDPTALLDLWDGVDLAVIVDAVRTGSRDPGQTIIMEVTARTGPQAATPWAPTGRRGTHAIGLASAIELARALDRLPPRIVIVGVEAASFTPGAGLSPPLAAAVADTVDTVCALLAPHGARRRPTARPARESGHRRRPR